MEFKVVEKDKESKAIEQIKEKKYYEKYQKDRQEIYLIGMEFSEKEKNLVGFDVEEIQRSERVLNENCISA